MKILHTADWHLGARLQGRSRLPEQRDVLSEICDIAEREEVDAVVIAGDIFDTYSPPTEAERLYHETTARLAGNGSRAVVVIAGNHDSPDRLVASQPLAWSHGVITVGLPKDDPGTFDLGAGRVAVIESAPAYARVRLASGRRLSLILLAYPSESRLAELLVDSVEDEAEEHRSYNERLEEIMNDLASRFPADEPSVVVSHLFVSGGKEGGYERNIQVGGAYSVHYASFPRRASYVALGHLHAPQQFNRGEDAVVRYSGSILQLGFGEAGQKKSVSIVEFSGRSATVREVPLRSGKPLVRLVSSSRADLEEQIANLDAESWIGVDFTLVEGSAPEDLDQLRRDNPSIVDVAFAHQHDALEEEREESILRLSLEDQFRRYVVSEFNEPCDDEIVRLFLDLTEIARTE